MQPATVSAIAAMISGFGGSNTDPDLQIRAYEIAADGCSDDAIQRTAGLFIRGEVKEHKASRLPTSAEFGKECRSNHSAIQAAKNRRPQIAAPEPEYPIEHRERMAGLLRKLNRAMCGDRQAQKELEPWGWKQ